MNIGRNEVFGAVRKPSGTAKTPSGRSRGVAKKADISRDEVVEAAGGELFGVILAFGDSVVLLVRAVVVMAQFVHEDVQQHEGADLSLGKTAHDGIVVQPVVRQTEAVKDGLMGVKIGGGNFHPKIFRPGVQENPSGFFAVVEPIETVAIVLAAGGQHDA